MLSQARRGSFLLAKEEGNKQGVGVSGWFSLQRKIRRSLLQSYAEIFAV